MNAGFDLVYDTVSSGYTDGQIWIDRHGTATKVMGAGRGSVNPVPRPDGKALMVKRLAAGGGPDGGNLAVIDLAGHVIQTVPGTATCFPGGWINTTTILIACGGTDSASWHVISLGIDGSHRHVLTPDDPGDAPALSPDGHQLVYGYQLKAWAVPIAGGTPRLVNPATSGGPGAWSPDGKYLAESTGSEIDLATPDGRSRRKIADLPDVGNDVYMTFSPDGRSLIVTGSADVPSNFWIVPVDGTPARELNPAVAGGDPQRLP